MGLRLLRRVAGKIAAWFKRKPRGDDARAQSGPRRGNRRRSIFLWAFGVCGLLAAVNLTRPVEDIVQGGRDWARSRPYEGNVTVVAVDDRSMASLGGVQYPRQHDAKLLDRLFDLGARRVFYDRAHADPTTPDGDRAFIRALKQYSGRVYLGVLRSWDAGKRQFAIVRPLPQFEENAKLVSLNGRESPFSLSMRLPFATPLDSKLVPGLSSALNGRFYGREDFYRPDWSIQMRTVPTVSMMDVLQDRVTSAAIAGRDIVIGPTSTIANDIHGVVNQGFEPGLYFHVVGSQTLGEGMPYYPGHAPAFAFATLVSLILLYSRRKQVRAAVLATGITGLVFLPFALDAMRITVNVVPSMLMLGIVAYRGQMLRRVEDSGHINASSGFSNIAALYAERAGVENTLVALKMRNLPEIASSFDRSIEGDVISEVQRRMAMAEAGGGTLYHGEETLFWFTPFPVGEELGNHLEGLRALLSRPIALDGREVDLSIAFGADGDISKSITSRVGSATLSAEEAAAENLVYKFYDTGRREDSSWQLSLLSRLEVGMDKGEVWLAYQPQLHLATARISSAEALVRWSHPERGLIPPLEFIALAERHNRVERLTGFVLDAALDATRRMNDSGIDFAISVNLPVQMLSMPHLQEMVEEALGRYGLSPDRLVLEVTETGRLDRNGSAIEMMRNLSNLGVGMAIDDYGTGNATLDYLKIIPATEIKIDRQFITGMAESVQDRILVSSTIEMVHSLGRRVVAEGVETPQQLQALAEYGCDIIQGFTIGRPMTFDQLRAIFVLPEAKLNVR